jgi:hypothetical protein
MHVIEDIGPILGIVAFLGFAILALLIVLQAREVRRLREWAGRAPERALEADEAALAAGEARDEGEESEKPSRLGTYGQRVAGAVRPRWDELDRRSPVDPFILLAIIVAAAVVTGVLTGGFGLFGSDEAPTAAKQAGGKNEPALPEVAVLNATEVPGVSDPVPGIADAVAKEVVKPADFAIGVKTDALVGEEDSVVMFEPEAEDDASSLADAVNKDLGDTGTEPMTEAVRNLVKGAPLALLVGAADSSFGGDATATGTVTTP